MKKIECQTTNSLLHRWPDEFQPNEVFPCIGWQQFGCTRTSQLAEQRSEKMVFQCAPSGETIRFVPEPGATALGVLGTLCIILMNWWREE